MRLSASITALCLAAGALYGGGPARTMTCGTCHRDEAQSLPRAAMGIGIEIAPDQPLLIAHPHLAVEANGYAYTIERHGNASVYSVTDGSGSLKLPIRYAFGVHNETFVFDYQGRYYESMVSYYETLGGLAITMGSEQIKPHNLVEAMGRLLSGHDITACFNCHGTRGVTQGKLTLDTLQPALTCERCHEGAGAHLAALNSGSTAPVPKKLADLGAEEMSELCGQCHRTWASVVGQRTFGQKNVRFQPYRLANSKCFLGDDKRIRCSACHNPHHELVRDQAAYDQICLSCHALRGTTTTLSAATLRACPVADTNCVSCHMPEERAPGNGQLFHDHDIRVVHAGDSYPN